MKKIIALALALTMAFSMALTVSAKESYVGGSTLDTYTANEVAVVITMNNINIINKYAFDIEYGTMEFTYGEIMEWDPTEYKYVSNARPAAWGAAEGANKITVINHSDMSIYCAADAKVTDTVSGGFKLSVSEGDTIKACKVGDVVGSNFHEMFVTLEGEPYVSSANQMKIGAVIVTISSKAPATNDTTTEEPTEKPTEEPTENVQ